MLHGITIAGLIAVLTGTSAVPATAQVAISQHRNVMAVREKTREQGHGNPIRAGPAAMAEARFTMTQGVRPPTAAPATRPAARSPAGPSAAGPPTAEAERAASHRKIGRRGAAGVKPL